MITDTDSAVGQGVIHTDAKHGTCQYKMLATYKTESEHNMINT